MTQSRTVSWMTKWKWTCRAALWVFLNALSFSTMAEVGKPGTLDQTWGANSPLGAGKVMTPIGSSNDTASAIALQPNGKVLLGGTCGSGGVGSFCLARHNPDGSLDTTFGIDGKVTTPVAGANVSGSALAVQADGKILLAATCTDVSFDDRFCVIRYLPNGAIDSNFGIGGTVSHQFARSYNSARSILVQADGKVVVAGYCQVIGLYFCAVRFLSDGAIDMTFGIAGTLTTSVSQMGDYLGNIVQQPDGKIVAIGTCRQLLTQDDFCVVRYETNGALDSSFANAGKLVLPTGSGLDGAVSVALQPDGRLVVGGYCFVGGGHKFCIARVNADGVLDMTFGPNGIVVTPMVNSVSWGAAVAIQPNGQIVFAGNCYNGTYFEYCVTRYQTDGTVDTGFGNAGKVIIPTGNGGLGRALALQYDGKILLTGGCENGATTDFCTVRLDGGPFGYRNCSLDIDGDGGHAATIDGLIMTRVMMGFSGDSVINGINFAAHASRKTWPLIREHLITQCGMSLP